jgi:hypothetical protein
MTSRAPGVVNPRHQQASRNIARPEPGYFRMRLVKGGPLVGARIVYQPTPDPETGDLLDRSWYWSAVVNDERIGDPCVRPSDAVFRIWESGERIDEPEYAYLIASARWASEFAPDDPMARPREKIDLMSTPIPF